MSQVTRASFQITSRTFQITSSQAFVESVRFSRRRLFTFVSKISDAGKKKRRFLIPGNGSGRDSEVEVEVNWKQLKDLKRKMDRC